MLGNRFLQRGQCTGLTGLTRNWRGEFRYGFKLFLEVWSSSPVSGAQRLRDGYVKYLLLIELECF